MRGRAGERRWVEPREVDVPGDLRALAGGHRLVAESLLRRGITGLDEARRFLSAEHYRPASAEELPDMEPAVDRLRRAIRGRERVLIWGDFDVDGQTATALLFSALRSRGASVGYHVPNRFSEGHGIHLPSLARKLDAGVDLLLTCDTGVSAHEAIDYARGRGVDTVITDHHVLPPELPAAQAVVNPRRLPAGHALRELPGVGVAYKLIEALFDGDGVDAYLDLVGLGIVADVMAQVDDTRYLLQRGLEKLRENRRVGLRAMLERAQIDAEELNEGHIGFALGPRLNALGRLDDANPAVELLTTDDWGRARLLANSLEGLNARRKFLSNQVYQSAMAQIEGDSSLLDYAALVLSHSDWHSGVIGIVAGRLAEELGRPTVLIATPDGIGRGSARSVAGLDITAAFDAASALLTGYGGHSMAAGLRLPAEDIFAFRRELSRIARESLGERPPTPTLTVDGYLELDEISLELTRDIESLAPFGNGNPPLTLATRDVRVLRQSGLGRRGEHLQLEVEDGQGRRQRVIWWRGVGRDVPAGRFDMAYTLRADTYRGRREALVEWLDYRQRESAAVGLSSAEFYDVVDYRSSRESLADLAVVRERHPDALLWSEAEVIDGALDRLHLRDSDTLIVWTVPPSLEIWRAALATVNPARLVLFAHVADAERPGSFLRRLAALIQYALNRKGGLARLEALAAAMGHRERSVRLGLQAMRAMGRLDYRIGEAGEYRLFRVDKGPGEGLDALQKRLDMLLRETRAYRRYWSTMRMED